MKNFLNKKFTHEDLEKFNNCVDDILIYTLIFVGLTLIFVHW